MKYTGNSFPFASRDIEHRYFLFNISLDFSERKTFYIKFRSENPLDVQVNLYEQNTFQKLNRHKEASSYIYFGLLLSLLIYNLVYFLYLRVIANLYLSFYIFFVFLYQFTVDGFGFEFFWPNSVYWNNISVPIFLNISLILGWIFTRKFLEQSYLSKKLKTIYIGFITYHSCLIALAFLLQKSWIFWLGFSCFFSLVGIIVLTSCYYKKDNHLVVYLLSAWVILFLFSIVFMMKTFGLMEYGINSLKIGFIIQIFIHSLGLTNQIFITKKRKEKHFKSLIEEQKLLIEQKQQLVDSLTKFMPHQFIQLLGKNSITELEAGDFKKKEMTVLFADIRSFTQISENMTPEENFDFINTYLRVINPVIRRYGGIIDKYIGDAVMVIFPNSPDNAVSCAVSIVKSLRLFNVYQKKSKSMPIEIGIGIHTGEMILGTVGDDERMDSTVISDTVNIASRLEKTTKIFGTTIIISQQTLIELDDPTIYNFRIIGKIKVRGKKKAVSVIEMLHGIDKKSIKLKIFTKAEFEKGIINFHAKNFTDAIGYFKNVLKYNSKDKVTDFYLKKAIHYRMNKINKEEDWTSIEL